MVWHFADATTGARAPPFRRGGTCWPLSIDAAVTSRRTPTSTFRPGSPRLTWQLEWSAPSASPCDEPVIGCRQRLRPTFVHPNPAGRQPRRRAGRQPNASACRSSPSGPYLGSMDAEHSTQPPPSSAPPRERPATAPRRSGAVDVFARQARQSTPCRCGDAGPHRRLAAHQKLVGGLLRASRRNLTGVTRDGALVAVIAESSSDACQLVMRQRLQMLRFCSGWARAPA